MTVLIVVAIGIGAALVAWVFVLWINDELARRAASEGKHHNRNEK